MNLSDGGQTWQHDSLDYWLSDRKAEVKVEAVHEYLTTSYWSKGIPLETVQRSIANSLCFSIFDANRHQIGFARIVSDSATTAYLADVYVLEAHRGKGLAKWMMDRIMGHSGLQGLKRWTLATRDMHELYKPFGFKALGDPHKFMEFLPAREYG